MSGFYIWRRRKIIGDYKQDKQGAMRALFWESYSY